MTETAERVLAYLDALGIGYDLLCHAPVHTIGDSAPIDAALKSLTVKNYFLCTRNKKQFRLCIVRPEARLRTADISKQAGTPRLGFADADALRDILHTYPGAVSPLGLIFDTAHRAGLIVDRALLTADRLTFHPCENTASAAMAAADFFNVFLPSAGVEPCFVDIHDFQADVAEL